MNSQAPLRLEGVKMVKIESSTEDYKNLLNKIKTEGNIRFSTENGGQKYEHDMIDKETGVHLGHLCSFIKDGEYERYMLIYD